MPFSAYLTVKGQKQGAFNGPVTQKGRENSILVHAFHNEILSDRDSASGLPTGKREHKPVTILKDVDRTSPLMWNALVTNEGLTFWELKFWKPNAAGVETEVYTVSLVNAGIASIKESMVDNEIPANANLPLREAISFTYQKIEWTWTEGGVSASDDWELPAT
jgi:type VI secretion system secreted protein Hcp